MFLRAAELSKFPLNKAQSLWLCSSIFVSGCHEANAVFREAVNIKKSWGLHNLKIFLECVLLARLYNDGEFHALQSEKKQAS